MPRDWTDRALNRRDLLRGATLAALLAALPACRIGGEDDDEESQESAPTPEGSTAPTSTRFATPIPAGTPTEFGTPPVAAGDHPRLWVRTADLPRLRGWASDSNPIYTEALLPLAEQGKADMDSGAIDEGDGGSHSWELFPTESYAQLFAFMSLIVGDEGQREDYAQRARTLLMRVIDEAAKGPEEDAPFRNSGFAVRDRARWWGESFGLTVDWIYPTLSTDDKTTIREVFLRWIDENLHADTADHNHPEPIGVAGDPALIADPTLVRWALNNYFSSHMRNIGLMALSFDPADDPDGTLTGFIANATGAWLYMIDAGLREFARGGLPPEGFEYSPQALGYVIQFLLALHTAGQDDPARWGPQVTVENLDYWDDSIPALFNSLSPRQVRHEEMGLLYLPAWYGDGQNYWAPEYIGLFGPLGIYDQLTGNVARLNAARWIQQNVPPGGAERFIFRIGDVEDRPKAIQYFLLFDPQGPEPTDPRPNIPPSWFAPGIGHLLVRHDWGPDAGWFTFSVGWQAIYHQHADALSFEFYRRGEWLTKERTGYGDNIAASDYHNTLALENDELFHNEEDDYRYPLWKRGSQWLDVADDPPGGQLLAHSVTDAYVYGLGDATGLYNSTYEEVTQITHASRSIVWLRPDVIVTYDRASSKSDGYFKRWWLQLPAKAQVDGRRATMTSGTGQQLFITTLLPTDAEISSEEAEPLEDDREPAVNDIINFRLKVEAPGGPADVRFLHVLQGADPGTASLDALAFESSAGTPCAGALVGDAALLFPVTLGDEVQTLTYRVPAGTTRHLITGLTPEGSYGVTQRETDGMVETTITSGGDLTADEAGVVFLT